MTEDKPLYTETYYPPFFFPYAVTVTKNSLSFGYYFWLFTKTVDLSQTTSVVKARPIEHVKGFRQWGGWGIRLRRHDGHWETGYIAKNGKAVKITVQNEVDEPSYYVFTCSNPQKVCDLINKAATK